MNHFSDKKPTHLNYFQKLPNLQNKVPFYTLQWSEEDLMGLEQLYLNKELDLSN